jgi:acyl-CoA dehydrogenase
VHDAQRNGTISGKSQAHLVEAALAAGIITPQEQAHLRRTATLRDEVIRVDDFPQDFGRAELEFPPAHKAAA